MVKNDVFNISAGVVELGFDGAFGARHDLGDFPMAEPLVDVQDDDRFLLRSELMNGQSKADQLRRGGFWTDRLKAF